MNYLWASRFIPLIILSDGKVIIIYIDDAHAIHTNCKGHSGSFVSQGKGAMINVYKKTRDVIYTCNIQQPPPTLEKNILERHTSPSSAAKEGNKEGTPTPNAMESGRTAQSVIGGWNDAV